MTLDEAKLAKHMLQELENPYKILNKWEEDFIESVTDQFNNCGSLSPKQFEVLERIYTEKTA